MRLQDITDPNAVHRAVAEYEDVGQERFLAKYGFGPAREYVLVLDGGSYDSKAILGAAHGYQFPDLGPLRSSDFNGGTPTIAKLEELGFTVERVSGDATQASDLAPILREFLEVYGSARQDPFRGNHPAAQLLKSAASLIDETLPTELSRANVRPSVGQGNWAAVPWIAVLDPRVTTSTQHGVYPVILIREDLSGLYVTIAQGVTDLKREHGQARAYEALRSRARELEPFLTDLGAQGFEFGASVDLGNSGLGRDYAVSTVVSRFFESDALVSGDVGAAVARVNEAYASLLNTAALDTQQTQPVAGPQVMAIYVGQGAVANFESGGRRGWWGWTRTPVEENTVRPGDLVAFGRGFTGGSPRVEGDAWRRQRLRQVTIGRVDRPPFRTDEAIMPDEISGDARYPWKFRFTILGDEEDISLTPGDAVNEETSEAFRLSAVGRGRGGVAPVEGSPLLERYADLKIGSGRVSTADVGALVDQFSVAVRHSGVRIDDRQLRAFLASALTKPFVILTGQSGSGKTQLAKRLGEWCGETAEGKPRYLVVPVRPDWTGPEFLFGYPDALAKPLEDRAVWAVPETLEFLLTAHQDPGAPYVLVLDEMNLAHVERYFADFLSGIESREPVLPNLVEREGGRWVETEDGGRLPLPSNVIVIGTVNVDETTYMFSPKVLDRAFAHEFRVASSDLDPALRRPSAISETSSTSQETIVHLLRDDDWQFEFPHPDQEAIVETLRQIHVGLSAIGMDFGHRVLFEAVRFAAVAHAGGLDSGDEVLDFIALTKILPKVHGSRQRLENPLRVLKVIAVGETDGAPRMPRTAAKLDRMLEVLVDAQFVSFTE